MEKEYRADSVIGKYIRNCDEKGSPLNDIQIGELERVLLSSIGIKISEEDIIVPYEDGPSLDSLDFQKKLCLAGCSSSNCASIIYKVALRNKGEKEGRINNRDLIDLYKLFQGRTPTELRNCVGLHYPRKLKSLGDTSYIALRDYLKTNNLI